MKRSYQWIILLGAMSLLILLGIIFVKRKLPTISQMTVQVTPTITPIPTQPLLPCIASAVANSSRETYDCSLFTLQVPSNWIEEQQGQLVIFYNPASKVPVTGSPDYTYPRDKGKVKVTVGYEKTSLSIPEYIKQFDESQRNVGLTLQGTNTPCTLSTYACVERKYMLYGEDNYEVLIQNPQKNMIITLSSGFDFKHYLPLIHSIFATFRFK